MPDHAGSYAYPIAVIMQDNDPQEVEMALWHAITILRARGLEVGGFVQKRGRLRSDGRYEMYVHDLTDGSLVRLDRYRGAGARACTLDMDAMGAIAVTLRTRIEQDPDVLFINRFGVREAEGGGLRTEIAEAICRGIPVVVVVSRNHLPAWEAFIGQDHAAPVLPPRSASLLDWAHLIRAQPGGKTARRALCRVSIPDIYIKRNIYLFPNEYIRQDVSIRKIMEIENLRNLLSNSGMICFIFLK